MINHDEYTSLMNLQKRFLSTGIPFVSYQLPGAHQPVTLLTRSPLLRLDPGMTYPQDKPGFILAPFNPDEPKIWLSADQVLSGTTLTAKNLSLVAETGTLPQPGQQPPTSTIAKPQSATQPHPQPQASALSLPSTTPKAAYKQQLESILRAFQQGDLKKVVLSRVINIPFVSQKLAPMLFDALIHQYPGAFVYLLSFNGYGTWLGASPELLLSAQSNGPELTSIETMALAGTRKTVACTGPINLTVSNIEKGSVTDRKEQITENNWGEKEKDEHRWVSEYIMHQLEDTECRNVSASDTYTVRAGNVEHLRTDFSALIQKQNITELIHKLHPTPAVCGWPKYQALQLIKNTEMHDRSYYAGYLGPVNQELLSPSKEPSIKLYVNLRCMQLKGQRAAVYVGSGITGASEADNEWDETTHKSLTLLTEIEKLSNE